MFLKQMQPFALALVALVVFGLGVGLLARTEPPAQATNENKPEPPKPPARANDVLSNLLKARYEAAVDEHRERRQEYLAGAGTLDMLLHSSLRLLEAELEWKAKPAERIPVLEAHLERMKNIQDVLVAKFNAGTGSVGDLKQAEYYRLDAEVRLERAKQKAAVP
jgi:hypothetical protein